MQITPMRMVPMQMTIAALLAALALHGSAAFAWGDDGHRITGYIANSLLSDSTKQRLRILLGSDDLALIATWMDDERETLNRRLPGSARWHYENRAACSSNNDPCPKGQCITQQIERFVGVVRDRQATPAQQAEAIRIMVHLLGDLHQPLHLIDNDDRGGNDIYVRLPREREPRRLHEVWDTRVVRMNLKRKSDASYARLLADRYAKQRADWQIGSIEQWASETHTLGREHAYGALPDFACGPRNQDGSDAPLLAIDYIETAKAVIDSQLAKAGVRIAWVLNQQLPE